MVKANQRHESAFCGIGDAPPVSEERLGELSREGTIRPSLATLAFDAMMAARRGRFNHDAEMANRALWAGATLREAVGVLKFCHAEFGWSADYYADVVRNAMEEIPVSHFEVVRTKDVASMLGVPKLTLGRIENPHTSTAPRFVFITTLENGARWKLNIGMPTSLAKQNRFRYTALMAYGKLPRKVDARAFDVVLSKLVVAAERIGPGHPLYPPRCDDVSGGTP